MSHWRHLVLLTLIIFHFTLTVSNMIIAYIKFLTLGDWDSGSQTGYTLESPAVL